MTERRNFVKSAALATIGTSLGVPVHIKPLPERKFKLALNPGLIGVKASLNEAIDYAVKYKYEAVSPYINEAMKYGDGQLNEIVTKVKENKLDWDTVNIPVEWRQSKSKFNDDFKNLRAFCQTMEKLGATRINTWIISSSKELTYTENMKQTAYRLGECARVMKDYGVRLGIEYLGMRTLLNLAHYPFISTLKECRELIANIGESNVGMVLDTFHWYCADDKLEDIRTLKAEEVSHVDLNDARAGFTRLEQQDGKRELPMATGVINTKDFMQGLLDIGFDGPLRTEPFNQALNDMDNGTALQVNMDSLKKALATVGL